MQPFKPLAFAFAGALAAVALGAPALGQADRVKKVQGKSGEEVRATVIGSAKPDCTVAARPEVRVITPANSGVVRLTQGALRTSRVQNCPVLEIPAVIVLYRSNPGFIGADSFTVEAVSATGTTQRQTVNIDVM
jgi:hypothetical protein